MDNILTVMKKVNIECIFLSECTLYDWLCEWLVEYSARVPNLYLNGIDLVFFLFCLGLDRWEM